MIVNTAVLVAPPKLTVIVEFAAAFTAVVFIVNVTEDLPAGITTVAGTVADFRLLVSTTFRPPVGAGALTPTTPVLVFPPFTVTGFR